MAYRLIIDGNSVYEIDEECERNHAGAGGRQTEKSRQRKRPGPGGSKDERGKKSS